MEECNIGNDEDFDFVCESTHITLEGDPVVCCECRVAIEVGQECIEWRRVVDEDYGYDEDGNLDEDVASADDGELEHTCLDCDSVNKAFCTDGSLAIGELWDAVAQCAYDQKGVLSEEKIALLTPVAKAGVLKLCDEVLEEVLEDMAEEDKLCTSE